MTNYIVTCNTLNQKKLVSADGPPETCPVDGCNNFIEVEDL